MVSFSPSFRLYGNRLYGNPNLLLSHRQRQVGAQSLVPLQQCYKFLSCLRDSFLVILFVLSEDIAVKFAGVWFWAFLRELNGIVYDCLNATLDLLKFFMLG